jgi:hypothetical protein
MSLIVEEDESFDPVYIAVLGTDGVMPHTDGAPKLVE